MAFTLKSVVPWGRNFDEYRAMFNLTEEDLQKRILGIADGPASFNSSLTRKGRNIVSVDPVYQFTAKEIKSRIDESCDEIVIQMHENMDAYVWEDFKNVEELVEIRMKTMCEFLEDFESGKNEHRYTAGELPSLSFGDGSFDLALCSHFLFLYGERFSYEFHLESIRGLCRISNEVRIYPLVTLAGNPSSHIESVMGELEGQGYIVEIHNVNYEFQKGANQMLRIEKRNEPL